ncbi:MAG TPA: transglutaminaseTgpA domain-containing protein [Gaiellaceae bacterium]|nr:transglutaminaseTgpA domain-containing protein [Gaiellaceae bacterium]
MARAPRTLLVSAIPAAVVALAWLRFERPREELWRAALLAALAIAVALVRPLPARLVAAVAAVLLAVWLAFGISPLAARPFDPHRAYFGPLWSRFSDGFLTFYDVRLPFDPRLHPDMASVVLLAVFLFALLVALAVDAHRPVAAALLLLVGAGWPATLLGPSRALAVGAGILLAALVVLAGLTRRRVPRATLPVAAVLALAALAASTSPAVAKRGVVPWQTWDPYTKLPPPVSVSFVWDSRYYGLRWPKKRTEVLEVQTAPTQSLYWRAAVLDDFVNGGWTLGPPRAADALEPPAAYQRRRQTEQVVTVKALADTRLVGGSVPIRFDAEGADLTVQTTGFAQILSGLPRGYRYRVWSYAPQPSAAALRRSPARYPSELSAQGLLDVWPGVRLPAFGTPDRVREVDRALSTDPGLFDYRLVRTLADRVTAGARTPYDATVRLEQWFRSSGGFRYTNRPAPVFPPLVGFLRTREGYCQHFAGAMALMLRYVGIPARVAVGFSSGEYDNGKGAFVVTDHDAHAWVEAWFAGYGWLPFDPTPSAGRPEQGTLSAGYSASSPGFGIGGGARPGTRPPDRQNSHRHGEQEGTGVAAAARGGSASAATASESHAVRNAILFLLLLAAALAFGGVGGTKLARRWLRRLPRDPRRAAAACRQELAAFLVDQRIEAARSATLHELGALVRHELAVDPDRFVAAATAARFGRVEGAAAAAREARRELRGLLRDVRRRLSGRERLRGLLSLRSLGLVRQA